MTFQRMMVVGAVASALVFTGCQDRRHDSEATGGAGPVNDQGTSDSIGGSGSVDDQSGVGGSGKTKTGTKGTMGARDAGTGGSDAGR